MNYLNYDVLFDILTDISMIPVTTKSLAHKYSFSERTIRRYLAILKNNKVISYEKNKGWMITVK